MKTIRAEWDGSDLDRAQAVYELSDGYGVVGLVPDQGFDWSGIRDSSTEAIEAMYAVARKHPVVAG